MVFKIQIDPKEKCHIYELILKRGMLKSSQTN